MILAWLCRFKPAARCHVKAKLAKSLVTDMAEQLPVRKNTTGTCSMFSRNQFVRLKKRLPATSEKFLGSS